MQKKQQGFGLISWLFITVVLAASIALVIKLTPIYVENYMVKRILDSVREEAASIRANGDNNQNLRDFIVRRLQANNIQHVNNNNISLTQTAANADIRIIYDVRIPIIANVDALLHFNNAIQVPMQ